MRRSGAAAKRRSGAGRREATLNLASLIDVTFLLLLFFLVTTVIAKPEDRLSPGLQAQTEESGPAADFQPQIVDVLLVGGAPGYRLGGEVLHDQAGLTRALEGLYRPAGLFVRVAGDVPVGFAAGALQAGRDAGFEQVTYVPVD